MRGCRMYTQLLQLPCCRRSKNKSSGETACSRLTDAFPANLFRTLRGRRGSQIVEAAAAMPVIILTAMLLLRLFTFYLEILSTGVSEHMTALETCDGYSGAGIRKYTSEREVTLLRGGILQKNVSKEIKTRTYMINEDVLVRAGDAID